MTAGGASTPTERERRAWVYLSAVVARPTVAVWDLVDERGVEEAAELVRTGRVGGALGELTAARRDAVDAAELLGRGERVGARVLVPGDPDWPVTEFASLDLPRVGRREEGRRVPTTHPLRPLALWWRGPADPAHVAARSVAVVGTRAPSAYGRAVAADLTAGVVAHEVAVVSGGAYGIDAASHRACLGAEGVSVAVLACGVDRAYPRGNSGLLTELAGRGALVSEHPPGTEVSRFQFLDRNRLIAALARATVVVEAAARSGALNTAAWATGMGRPVGAVPGPVSSVASVGCHLLVRERGATLVTRAEELVELAGEMGELAEPVRAGERPWDGLDDVTRRVLECVPPSGGAEPAEVALASAVPAATVRAVLGRLAAQGVVTRGDGGWHRVRGRGRQLTLGL